MSDRMAKALELADKCWGKAYRAAPEFVERYLEVAQELLLSRPVVMGDEFRAACREKDVRLPSGLHPNTWVSGVRALQQIGWLSPMQKVEPAHSHNHMPSVTLWRSNIFGDKVGNPIQRNLF